MCSTINVVQDYGSIKYKINEDTLIKYDIKYNWIRRNAIVLIALGNYSSSVIVFKVLRLANIA